MQKIIILGAGIAGISAAYHAQQKNPNTQAVIYEKSSDWGGLCGGFYISSSQGDFWFDNLVHLSFASDPYVQELFHASSAPIRHTPDPINYDSNLWIKHPAPNNLYPLPLQEKIAIIKDMMTNTNPKENLQNFEEWLRAQYGNRFTEKFPLKYTRKYWTTEAKDLSISWVGPRFYTPNLEEVLQGAMSPDTPNTYYAQEMRYPKEGQYRSFLKSCVKDLDIRYNKEAIFIDPHHRVISFSDGSQEVYSHLISTLPLPEIIKILSNTPEDIKESASKLKATSSAIISLGFNKPDIAKNLWFYVYDEDKLFARVYSPSNKSSANAPKGCSSLQAEIYFSDFTSLESLVKTIRGDTNNIPNTLIQHVIDSFIQMGICQKEDIICRDFRILPYGNIIFTHDLERHRSKVLEFLDSQEIISCGRFGEWDYLWSDQSFLSGKKASEKTRRNNE